MQPIRAIFFLLLTSYTLTMLPLIKEKKFTPSIKSLRVYTLIPEHIAPEPQSKLTDVSLRQLVSYIQTNKAPSRCMLKIKGSQKKVLVSKGIDSSLHEFPYICLVSRGYAKRDVMLPNDYLELVKKGGGIIAAHMMLKDTIITDIPCVTFDYPDARAYFNFGQDLDVACLRVVWDEILKLNPRANIIGLGDCRGAKALLTFATHKPDNLAALILISPFVSTLDMIQQLSNNYLNWLPKSDVLLHEFFKTYFPNYNPIKDRLLDQVHMMSHTIPIFIGQRKNDYLASDESIMRLIRRLRQAGNDSIHITMVSDGNATHSRITPIAELQKAVKKFLTQYELY